MRKYLLVSLLLFVLLVGGCTSDQQLPEVSSTPTGDVVGRVEFPSLSGTKPDMDVVKVYLDDEEYTLTTYDGQFQFKGLSLGNHTLQVKDVYYESDEIEINLTEDGMNGLTIPARYAGFIYVQSSVSFWSDATDRGRDYFQYLRCWDSVESAVKVGVRLPDMMEEDDYLIYGASTTGTFGFTVYLTYLLEGMILQPDTYEIEFVYYNADDEEITKKTKNFTIEHIHLNSPENTDTGKPTFSWSPISQNDAVSYDLYINEENSIDAMLIASTSDVSYTLKNALTSGTYECYIIAYTYDKISGQAKGGYCSEIIEFTID